MRPHPPSPRARVAGTVGALLFTSLVSSAAGVAHASPRSVTTQDTADVSASGPVAANATSGLSSSPVPVLVPVTPIVRSYPVTGVSPTGVATLATVTAQRAASSYAALSAPEPAHGVVVTGATWTGRAPAGLALDVRTRIFGTWSGWTSLPYDTDHGPSPRSAEAAHDRPGTDPFVAGHVDHVQLRVTSDSGVLPAGLALAVIDPGASQPVDVTSLKESTTRSAAAASPAATVPLGPGTATPPPAINSRAAWGADERLRDCCVEYGEVHAGFVHHTVNANDYTRAEVPAILRGIYAYHTQSRGWRDIGYNFLIDRFGRIWEGRYGGVALPVVGAHTLNYNENSFAGSAIGNFDIVRPSAAMIDAYARLFAWKLSLHGVRPHTRQKVAGTTFDAISGHRDAAQTACPGRYLYAQIPTIITLAGDYQHLYVERNLHRSFLRGLQPDVLLASRQSGSVAFARGTGSPGFEVPLPPLAGFSGRNQVTAVRDVTGDGANDLMMRTAATGRTVVYPGRRDGTFASPVHATTRWSGTDLFAGPGDVTGDGLADVVARRSATATLLMYPGRGDGTFGTGRAAVSGLASVDELSAAGDFDRDGDLDLLALGVSGVLRVLRGDGTGHFPTSVRLATGWSAYDVVMGGVDLTGDGWNDVAARNPKTQTLHVFASVNGESLSAPIVSRSAAARPRTLSRDITSDRRPDLVSIDRQGKLIVTPARRQNWVTAPTRTQLTWAGTDRVMVVGDWDGDHYVDAMARERTTGMMWLYRGTSTGGFGPRRGGWSGWTGRSLVTPVGDFDGDGHPDLMAKTRDGGIWLYPGRARNGFGQPIAMRSALPSGASIVSVGLWNKDGAPDVLVRTSSGTMLLYPGNGPGGLDDPVVAGNGFADYNAVLGAGDLTGDGQPDLLGRSRGGRVWLIAGAQTSAEQPGGGFAPRRYVGANWGPYFLG